jgi:hypothetical protein
MYGPQEMGRYGSVDDVESFLVTRLNLLSPSSFFLCFFLHHVYSDRYNFGIALHRSGYITNSVHYHYPFPCVPSRLRR